MNIYDIARTAGVSPATVSRVLNQSAGVREETRKRVLSIIEKNEYVPSAAARNLSMRTTCNIGVIVPDIANGFFASLLMGVNQAADEYDYNTVLFGTKENVNKQYEVLQTVRQENLKGLIIVPVIDNDARTIECLRNFENEGIPIVLIDRDIQGASFDGVFSEDKKGAKDAVKLLISEGHRKIAVIKGPETSRPGRMRFSGYRDALEEQGLPIEKKYIMDGDFMMDTAYEAAKRLMSLPEPPTAIFSSNNQTTLGCLKCFHEMKLRIGHDIGFAGFDEIEALKYVGMGLTVVDRDVVRMGAEAMKLLLQRFHETLNTGVHRKIMLETKLLQRGSEQYDWGTEGHEEREMAAPGDEIIADA